MMTKEEMRTKFVSENPNHHSVKSEKEYLLHQEKMTIKKLKIEDRWRHVSNLYNEGRTLKEVGKIIGLTPERVRQIINQNDKTRS